MPLHVDAEARVKANLDAVRRGDKPAMKVIGELTQKQFDEINAVNDQHNQPHLGSREVVYIGRHHYGSRHADGYSIHDMWLQVESSLSELSVVSGNAKMTRMQNPVPRADGYNNAVRDMAVFELTQRKPRAELYSAIPKGDKNTPNNAKSPP